MNKLMWFLGVLVPVIIHMFLLIVGGDLNKWSQWSLVICLLLYGTHFWLVKD